MSRFERHDAGFTAVVSRLLQNTRRHAEGAEIDALIDGGEFSGPTTWRHRSQEAANILGLAGWTSASLEAEARRRGLSEKWLHYTLAPALPDLADDECGYYRAPRCLGGGPVYFVAAYAIQRCYGGPEEGGWWYDAGEPVACRVALTEQDAERAADELRAQYPRTKRRYSVLGGADHDVRIEFTPPVAFPAVRPHYE